MKIKFPFLAIFVIVFYILSCETSRNTSKTEVDKTEIKNEFLRIWKEYKEARIAGDITAALKFYPKNEKVLHVREGKIYWISYRDIVEEYRKKKFIKIADIEGPFIKVAGCGCCVWISGKTRYTTDEEEEVQSWIDTYETTEDGGWQQTASSNSVENPRQI